MAETASRGRALAGYDAAAWHATDAVLALKPDKNSVLRYVARKTDAGWEVVWGRINEAGTKFLAVYEAKQKGDSNDYTVTKNDPPAEADDFYLRAALAQELARKEFFQEAKPKRPYNISVLPAANGQWYIYAVPGQTDATLFPYGGDVRYTVSADGTQILEKRQMHKTVLEEQVSKTPPEFDFHTHFLSDVPEDSDVFYALTRRATNGEWIGTKNYFYEVRAGSLRYIGTTAEIVKLLQDGKGPTLDPSHRAMLLSTAQELLTGSFGDPVQVFASFQGARCTDKTLWLKFSMTLHNGGDRKIVLYRDPLRNFQARFGASATEILSGRYEKVGYFTSEQVDFSSNDSYMLLSPSMAYSREHEYPVLGLDLKGKTAVQFLFFTWPMGEEKQVETQRTRLKNVGDLYADTIFASPVALTIDPDLLKQCPPTK